MLSTVQKYILSHQLPAPPSHLLVALSGGADSVALLLILQQLGYRLTALHCNFHLRGQESDRDEDFVRQLCKEQGLPLHVQHFSTAAYALKKGVSIEMAARQLRYTWFEEMRQQLQATAIAVAHHKDDNAETLLLNLVRGSGLRGLKGMLPRNGFIIRPLLGVDRKALESYLQKHHQKFVTDSTNLQTVYKRNKIRHEILPMLQELNPAVKEGLAKTAERLAEAEQLFDYALQQLQRQVTSPLPDGMLVRLDRLKAAPAPKTLLHELLQPFGFKAAEISQMAEEFHRPAGTCFASPHFLANFHRGNLEVRKRPIPYTPRQLSVPGQLETEEGTTLTVCEYPRELIAEIPKTAEAVAIDADAVQGQLTLRRPEKGDRFQPFGMKGTKLVSDYLTDRHRSLIDKMSAWVLCDEKGILWLLNERPAQRAAIHSGTRRILLCQLIFKNQQERQQPLVPEKR